DADFIEKSIFPRVAAGYNANIPILQSAAFRGGHFSPWIDDDGVVRRIPLLFEYKGNHYESLSLAVARIILDAEWVEPVFANTEDFADTGYPKLEWL
ncbi:MAG: CHASE2 domain-containing protein, partial [Gammaproteobacteria bacterium]|nr:CHASE2 domain-containing protein [Gammaproteobacteria bacterium]